MTQHLARVADKTGGNYIASVVLLHCTASESNQFLKEFHSETIIMITIMLAMIIDIIMIMSIIGLIIMTMIIILIRMLMAIKGNTIHFPF